MRLLIAVVTHNRLAYTQRCLHALDSVLGQTDFGVGGDYKVVVVDNASDDGTVEWLMTEDAQKLCDKVIFNKANRYPGAACNQGWMVGLMDFEADLLCRLDNDCIVQPGLFEHVNDIFTTFDQVGQVGLIEMSDAKEFGYKVVEVDGVKLNVGPTNIGGPNVIRHSLWDQGLRYSETPWQHYGGPTPQEDVKLSLDIKNNHSMDFGNITEKLCIELSFGNTDDYFDYYSRTFQQRGHGIPARTKGGMVIEEGTTHAIRLGEGQPTTRDHI